MRPGYIMAPATVEEFMYLVEPVGACWNWKGKVNAFGRPIICVHHKKMQARRIMWEIFFGAGSIRPRLFVRNVCGNSLCVNPSHHSLTTKRGLAIAALIQSTKHVPHKRLSWELVHKIRNSSAPDIWWAMKLKLPEKRIWEVRHKCIWMDKVPTLTAKGLEHL